jgi:hypothetical protein
MLDFDKIILDGTLIAIAFLALLIAASIYNFRLFLNKGDIPPDIFAAVAPKTDREKRVSLLVSIPILLLVFGLPLYSTYTFAWQNPGVDYSTLFAHLFLVSLIPNLADLLILDWLIINTITPSFFVHEGTEGFAGYKDYGFHLRQHLIALPFLTLVVAGFAWLVFATA